MAACFVFVLATPAQASSRWLCKPGMADNPCEPSLKTTRISPTGATLGVQRVKRAKDPKVDCFYVYPTTSDQTGPLAKRTADPELKSIALYQASRYSRDCRVFAPLYRQLTVPSLFAGGLTAANANVAYGDVRAAWRTYLRKYNKGRGVVFIGHSQGTFMLRRLLINEVDPKPKTRARLISAILLGGDVKVKAGKDVGGDFENIRACRSRTQIGCVIAYSTYGETPPADSLFGRTGGIDGIWGIKTSSGTEVLCTNPTALGGGAGKTDTLLPTAPFGGTLIAASIGIVGLPKSSATTAWVEYPRSYRATCLSANSANVLRISPRGNLPALTPSPFRSWGCT